MNQLVILSGKGGSGKTSVTGALCSIIAADPDIHSLVLVDADVDASNLELLIKPKRIHTEDFSGGEVASIDPDQCIACGKCKQACRFDAISVQNNIFQVDPISCEGCGLCKIVCPADAVSFTIQQNGHAYQSDTAYGRLFHAELFPGSENSGKLVAKIRQQAQEHAQKTQSNLIIIDGPPGIGCPVISTVTGASHALIVAEPSLSGIHDMERILETVTHFDVPAMVCINKYDIHPKGTVEIETYCDKHKIPIIGKLPFDEKVTHSMINGQPITTYYPVSETSQILHNFWGKIKTTLEL